MIDQGVREELPNCIYHWVNFAKCEANEKYIMNSNNQCKEACNIIKSESGHYKTTSRTDMSISDSDFNNVFVSMDNIDWTSDVINLEHVKNKLNL